MQVAEVSMDGGIDVEMRLFDWLYRVWLPTSGYLPADQPCFEAWRGRAFAFGSERFELAVQLPVCRV
jgi:DNA gyrase inhibitor GyrI